MGKLKIRFSIGSIPIFFELGYNMELVSGEIMEDELNG